MLDIRHMTEIDFALAAKTLSTIWMEEWQRTAFLNATREWVTQPDTDGCIVVIPVERATITGHELIAGVSGWYVNDDCAIMRWHGVLPEHRHQGLAGELLRWVAVDVRQHGYDRLYELSASDEAREYFVDLGFKDVTCPLERMRVCGDGDEVFQHVLRLDF